MSKKFHLNRNSFSCKNMILNKIYQAPDFLFVFYQNMQIWVYWIFWDHKTASIFYLFSCFRSVVLGGSSVKNSCQSERYFQRYSNFSGAMLLKKRLFRCVTLMSRYVCLFITNKILGIDSKFLRSVIGDWILRQASKIQIIRSIWARTREDGVLTIEKR